MLAVIGNLRTKTTAAYINIIFIILYYYKILILIFCLLISWIMLLIYEVFQYLINFYAFKASKLYF